MRVLITGANRGIGAALLARYHAAGHDVIGTARSSAVLKPLDVTEPGSVAALAERVGDAPLDLLVCNAGIYLDKGLPPEAYTAEMWAVTFAVNVTGVALTVQALLPALRDANGKIAIISSIMASDTHAPGGSHIYRASKAAVLNLGRNLASDLRGDDIAVQFALGAKRQGEFVGKDLVIAVRLAHQFVGRYHEDAGGRVLVNRGLVSQGLVKVVGTFQRFGVEQRHVLESAVIYGGGSSHGRALSVLFGEHSM